MIDTSDQTIEVENPTEVLREEDGTFEVTSPYGHIFRVLCRRGTKISVRQIVEPKLPVATPGVIWRIRRLHLPATCASSYPAYGRAVGRSVLRRVR